MTTTTPYSQVSDMDEGAFCNGLLVQWDEDHLFTYFVPKELAEAKYPDQVESDWMVPLLVEEERDRLMAWQLGVSL